MDLIIIFVDANAHAIIIKFTQSCYDATNSFDIYKIASSLYRHPPCVRDETTKGTSSRSRTRTSHVRIVANFHATLASKRKWSPGGWHLVALAKRERKDGACPRERNRRESRMSHWKNGRSILRMMIFQAGAFTIWGPVAYGGPTNVLTMAGRVTSPSSTTSISLTTFSTLQPLTKVSHSLALSLLHDTSRLVHA